MVRSQIVKEFVAMIEADVMKRTSPGEFEMAYQARVAIDRIRFAIKTTEMSGEQSEPLKEARMQLLDALDRLEAAEHGFQSRWRGQNHCGPRTLDLGAVHGNNGNARNAS